jgi:hypothetical protein
VAVTAAAAFALLEPDMLTYVFGGGVPLRQDPVRAALLWSVPLAFYLVPASIVGIAWVQLERRITTARALGFGLVFIGLANFPFILWLTHLWDVYIRTSGGEAVIARVVRALAYAVM